MSKRILIFPLGICLDGICVISALFCSFLLKFGTGIPFGNIEIFIRFFYVYIALHLFLYTFAGLYRFQPNDTIFDIVYHCFWTQTIISILIVVLVLFAQLYYMPDTNTSRIVLFYDWFLSFLGITAWRVLLMYYLKSRDRISSRVLILGPETISVSIQNAIESYSTAGHRVVGYMNPQTLFQTQPEQALEQIHKMIQVNRVNELIIVSSIPTAILLELVDLCEQSFSQLWVLPSLYEVIIGRLQIRQVAGIPLIELNPSPINQGYQIGKRLFDILFTGICLILALPFIILTTLAIKLTSKGPVFFRQERLGKSGKIFKLYKFRTMVENAEEMTGPVLASKNDPRIISIGNILRKTRLDEIPQLINVLKGDMSLVGPRPERPELANRISKTVPQFSRRLLVRPGITGLAQIHGGYDLDAENKLRYDLAYIYNINFLLDLKIILSTVKVIISGRGAR